MEQWLDRLAAYATALALVPAGAHLAALPNKLAMSRDAYLAAQGAYAGWPWLGVLPVWALLLCATLAWQRRRAGRPAWHATLAALLLAAGLGLFFAVILLANQATANWTLLPPDWDVLRDRWEWSHAANAVLTLLALWLVLDPQR